jgi:hypothetical protein
MGLISDLFSKGPRNDAEEAILDAHIKEASKQIQDSWTEEERELRASKAGSPIRQPAEVPIVEVDLNNLSATEHNG